ncbi:hypothetical protein GCM10009808_09860 [Microbacterium sediminicola]|uniref:GmrSD restriction endonucleases C-terminal domain-containing protein n=1 Tax=Microbacterium sediminicola TaxID=415210 RepID=A0ABP4TVZ6_9MICO
MRRSILVAGAIAVALGALVLWGPAVPVLIPSEPSPGAGAVAVAAEHPFAIGDAQSARDQLAGLSIVSGWSPADYDRDAFGEAWFDLDGNGCSTRNDILARDLLEVTLREDGCRVATGTLIDPYDGSVTDFVAGPDTSPAVQIDHVVALAWAWRHGADAWSDEQRIAFANDPGNLVAASAATNQAKSDESPAEWLPGDLDFACRFTIAWVGIVETYGLGVSTAEAETIRQVLEGC